MIYIIMIYFISDIFINEMKEENSYIWIII